MKRTRYFIPIIALLALALLALALLCTGCSGKRTMMLDNIDVEANTFDLVDSETGGKLAYEKLIVNGGEVVDWLCTGTAGSQAVVFATQEGQIVRDGNETTYSGQGYTVDARLEYELKDGVLTITGVKSP